jgi:hypothetical protein
MSQSTFEDDLFDEAADDIRTEVEGHLDAAHDALPEADEIWTAEADNTLGVLNSLSQTLDTGDAAAHLRDAKKSYTIGERADAFDDADDVAERIETLEAVMADVETANEHASELASTVPELRGALDEAHETSGDGDVSADDTGADTTDEESEVEQTAE